ncbi:DUF535 family protein [Noviherbaspirillum pedocola]|uniref:DUF535 family protein n=1 Tax=Noviherbaspirillum pedocola TaxID=2801341 RepID=A0A934STX5_9BURK|nr:DUF535 family protein [Noviherbaspirillum pedocola]MBK4736711.1 DUF535 family protein [Noviherbaspirillum pedocola]
MKPHSHCEPRYANGHEIAAAGNALSRAAVAAGIRLRRLARCLRVMCLFLDLTGHLRLLRVMAGSGNVRLLRRRPLVLFKYLHVNYLAANLGREERLAMLVNHYASLARLFRTSFLHRLFDEGQLLWRRTSPEGDYAIVLTFPRGGHDFEGEMRLEFRCGDALLYMMTATLVQGTFLRRDCGQALLITNVQGARGCFEQIRHSTRVFCDTPPAYLLLAALEGLAASLQVEAIAAVGNDRQLSRHGALAHEVSFDYDGFWTRLGGERCVSGFYLFAPRLPEKPLHLIKQRHRARTQRKRSLKWEVARSVATRLQKERRPQPTQRGEASIHESGGSGVPAFTSEEKHV